MIFGVPFSIGRTRVTDRARPRHRRRRVHRRRDRPGPARGRPRAGRPRRAAARRRTRHRGGAAGAARRGRAARRRRPRPGRRRPRRSAGSTRSATRRRWSGSASTSHDLPGYAGCNDLGTAVLLAAMARGRRRPAGAGELDGRLRRGPLRVSRARRRPGRRRAPSRPRRRPVRAPLPALRPAAAPGARCARTPRPTRATSTRRPSSRRSTSPRRGPARPAAARHRAALPQRLRPAACRATPRTPASPRSSARALGRGRGAAGVRGRRPAARLRARHATSPRRTWPRCAADGAGRRRCAPTTSPPATPHTVGDLAAALAAAVGGPAPVVTGEFRLGDVRHVTADTARIRAELGWKPTVDFEAGIAELTEG